MSMQPKRPARGDLYVFEGINGSGKNTVARKFAEKLMSVRGDDNVRLLTNPTPGPVGTEIRRYLAAARARKGGIPRFFDPDQATDFARELATLFVADRILMQAQLRELVGAGIDVVCDRYSLSTLVYQCAMIGDVTFSSPLAKWIIESHVNMLDPEFTIVLDLPVEVARERLRRRGENPDDLMMAPLEHVARAMYLSFPNYRYRDDGRKITFDVGDHEVIDAYKTTDEIVNEAMAVRERVRIF